MKRNMQSSCADAIPIPQARQKNADVTTYRMSTGLEALFGWLYLTHQEDRLKALWEEIQKIGEYQ